MFRFGLVRISLVTALIMVGGVSTRADEADRQRQNRADAATQSRLQAERIEAERNQARLQAERIENERIQRNLAEGRKLDARPAVSTYAPPSTPVTHFEETHPSYWRNVEENKLANAEAARLAQQRLSAQLDERRQQERLQVEHDEERRRQERLQAARTEERRLEEQRRQDSLQERLKATRTEDERQQVRRDEERFQARLAADRKQEQQSLDRLAEQRLAEQRRLDAMAERRAAERR